MKAKAPIALFTYNRIWHTRQTVQALMANYDSANSDLYIFSDGPKTGTDQKAVLEVREYLKSVKGFKSITFIFREQNHGLAASIIKGVGEVVSRHGKVIVLEDDMVTSPHFLRFMNDGLDLYEDHDKVACIHGYRYPIGEVAESFFMRGADCWGWGTWDRAWNNFNEDGSFLLNQLKIRGMEKAFNHQNSFPYTKMLKDQIAGKNDSWAIRWKASAFLNDQYTLYYKESLVRNIGNDDSGTHSTTTDHFDVELASDYSGITEQEVKEDPGVAAKISSFYRSITPSLWQRVSSKFFN